MFVMMKTMVVERAFNDVLSEFEKKEKSEEKV